MPIAAVVSHGTLPSYSPVNETGLLVLDAEFEGQREYVRRKLAGTRVTTHIRAEDPVLNITLTGNPIPSSGGALEGLAIINPGAAATLANFTTGRAYLGFDLADGGKIIATDPNISFPDQGDPTFTGRFEYRPFVVAS